MAEVIGEFEPDTITRPDGHISTNWDGIARNFLRKEILASAGLDSTSD